ncbi:hypothetical protein LCI01_06130 [Leuconostoc citreum]|uniref:hypothetical protein n=1 Tax=Leuconostoc citreum TaxID=33964 RepID=UPI00116F0DA3|nr:hypothetical protein [Leuconostoc citreum]GEK60977.1 hypothetical protein LCI01_06130 [Leuconostoc citreum]
MKTFYVRLETLINQHTRRFASTDKEIVMKGGYPVHFEIYGVKRNINFILGHTLTVLQERYGQDIVLVQIDKDGNQI